MLWRSRIESLWLQKRLELFEVTCSYVDVHHFDFLARLSDYIFSRFNRLHSLFSLLSLLGLRQVSKWLENLQNLQERQFSVKTSTMQLKQWTSLILPCDIAQWKSNMTYQCIPASIFWNHVLTLRQFLQLGDQTAKNQKRFPTSRW